MSSHPRRSTTCCAARPSGASGATRSAGPYVVPITYAFDGVAVYGHSREGLKLRMMRSHPTVCFEVDRFESALELAQRDRPRDVLRARVERGRDRDAVATQAPRAARAERDERPDGSLHASGLPWSVFRILLGERTGRFERPAPDDRVPRCRAAVITRSYAAPVSAPILACTTFGLPVVDRRRERAAHGSRCRAGRARRGGSARCARTGAS